MTTHPQADGLAGAFMVHRDKLLRFLLARGAGDAAEDLLQEVWIRISTTATGPVAAPVPYLFRVADLLMIDRYRSERQATLRNRSWSEATGGVEPDVSEAPSAERELIARQYLQEVGQALDSLGERPARVFRRHRIDGVAQRAVADELGVSLSTVESDLRRAYQALAQLKERFDEA